MKPVFLIGLGLAISLQAQVNESPPASPSSPPAPVLSSAQSLRSEADLNTLLGPIALYPDALIALILPASTTPSDIVLAARNIETDATPDTLAAQPWDDSVKALTHYPDLLRWLDQNLAWTQAVGEAFSAQPADVMNAVQRLRKQARDAGTLVDTPQQQIVTKNDTLLIVPAQPNVVYMPVYDPAIVYVSRPTQIGHNYLYFRSACPAGPWLNYRPNWRQGHVLVTPYPHSWGWPRQSYRYSPPRSPGRVWIPPSHNNIRLRPRPPVGISPSPGWNRPNDYPHRPTPPHIKIQPVTPFRPHSSVPPAQPSQRRADR